MDLSTREAADGDNHGVVSCVVGCSVAWIRVEVDVRETRGEDLMKSSVTIRTHTVS